MFCSKCGNQLKKEDHFCSSCGNIIEKENVLAAPIEKKEVNKKWSIFRVNGSSTLRKEYFKWLIIITIIFGLLEVALVFLMPFGEIHLKVLMTIGLIILFGLLGLLLISLYERTNQNKFPFVGIGVNAICFVLSSLLTWDILSGDFSDKTMFVLITLLIGLILISKLFTITSGNKYIDYSRNITTGAIITAVCLFSLGIYQNDLFDVDIFVRGMWAISILIVLGLFITLLLSKMFSSTDNEKK